MQGAIMLDTLHGLLATSALPRTEPQNQKMVTPSTPMPAASLSVLSVPIFLPVLAGPFPGHSVSHSSLHPVPSTRFPWSCMFNHLFTYLPVFTSSPALCRFWFDPSVISFAICVTPSSLCNRRTIR